MVSIRQIDSIQLLVHLLAMIYNAFTNTLHGMTLTIYICDWVLALMSICLITISFKTQNANVVCIAHVIFSLKIILPILNLDQKHLMFYGQNPDIIYFASWGISVLFWYFNCVFNFIIIVVFFQNFYYVIYGVIFLVISGLFSCICLYGDIHTL